MKSSLKKLRGLALNKSTTLDPKDKRENPTPAHQDELIQASQDIQDMRDCYDNLLSAAAATANSAYEFSESLREMGDCMLKKTALNDDEESGRVLLMLGKVQFELQKLVNSYRVHIVQTITTPSESLLKELQTVEEMKRQCDEKRDLYKDMLAAQREKGKTRSTKGESVSLEQMQAAKEDYVEEANLFVFRLKSLKQGQSRSLLTQAVRHHAAQLNLFRKAIKSLELVEPHVKVVAEQHHIDYQFSGLEDDYTEDDEENSYSYDGNDEEELTFEYGQNDQVQEVVSLSRNSMELDQVDNTDAASTTEILQENLSKIQSDLAFRRAPRPGSQSAPIFADKIEVSERTSQIQPSTTRKSHTYVLPTPSDAKPSFPFGSNKPLKDYKKELSSSARIPKPQSVLKESNINSGPIKLPLPAVDESALQRFDSSHNPFDTKKVKRQAFSGPLTSRTWSSKSMSSVRPSTSPKVSSNASPPHLLLSPRINELHELPRPPMITSVAKPTRYSSLVPHSAPLVSRGTQEFNAATATKRPSIGSSHKASPLPKPPAVMARSHSIPSSGQRTPRASANKILEVPRSPDPQNYTSPPLTPISLTSNQHPVSVSVIQTTKPKGENC